MPCYILDLEGTVVFANDATIQLTGYQREIDFKRSFLSQLDDEYIDKTIEHIKTVLNGERLQVQIEIRHQNNKNIPVDIVSIPLEIRGLVQGICGFILDQSEKSAVIHRLYDPSNWDKILKRNRYLFMVCRCQNNGNASNILSLPAHFGLLRGGFCSEPLFVDGYPSSP